MKEIETTPNSLEGSYSWLKSSVKIGGLGDQQSLLFFGLAGVLVEYFALARFFVKVLQKCLVSAILSIDVL